MANFNTSTNGTHSQEDEARDANKANAATDAKVAQSNCLLYGALGLGMDQGADQHNTNQDESHKAENNDALTEMKVEKSMMLNANEGAERGVKHKKSRSKT